MNITQISAWYSKQKKITERAAIEIRRVNQIIDLAYQLDQDFIDSFNYTRFSRTIIEDSYIPYNNNGEWKYTSSSNARNYGIATMRKETAIKLCNILNSGNYQI